ncbi:MAG: DsrH/TusB family sulfur metabolism protein [Thermoplasmata archaeon]
MKIAYLVLKSPHEQNPAQMIGRFSPREDSIAVLVEDGVYHAIEEDAAESIGSVANEVLVSGEDLIARGFSESDLKLGKVASYGDIVECIMERTERTITV